MSAWSYQASPELTDEQYARWQELLEQRTGICFLQHKSILQKGLSQRMREVGVENYEQYYEQVRAIPQGAIEWTQLVDRISVKETSFFREPYSYTVCSNFLRQRLSNQQTEQDYTLDLWSVGCSTGEEPYSLAMMAGEVVSELDANIFLGVIATDISQSALQTARRGVYSNRKVESLPADMKEKYFVQRSDKEYEVVNSLKQKLCFVQGNLLELYDIPQLEMDVIFCQNVLVYFRQERKREVLNELVKHLKPGGMLLLGPGEVIGWSHPKMKRTADESVLAYINTGSTN